MSPNASEIGKEIKRELLSLSSWAFQRKCFDLLQIIHPEIIMAKELGKVDSAGVDLYTIDEQTDSLRYAFQCKGFEVASFGDSQFRQVRESIISFSNSSHKVEAFYVILNRYLVEPTWRKALTSELDRIVIEGKAKKAHLLDVNGFTELLFELSAIELQTSLAQSNELFLQTYMSQMGQSFYAREVPFTVGLNKKVRFGPIDFIKENNLPLLLGKDNKRTWTFVTSEFGFGKTTLLLNLAHDLAGSGIQSLYVPVSQLTDGVFGNEHEFCRGLLSVVEDNNGRRDTSVAGRIKSTCLKNFLREKQNMVLLIDGLDEHPSFYKEDGLRRMFGCLGAFKSMIVFTARTEFINERTGTFEAALANKYRPQTRSIDLGDWDKTTMFNFVNNSLGEFEPVDARLRVEKFRRLIDEEKYNQLYGDIPKRPLFLKMLIQDIAESDLQKRSLADLYKKYIIQKFRHDRGSAAFSGNVNRPLSLSGDEYSKLGKLFGIMSDVAEKMTLVKENQLVLLPCLDERDIKPLIIKHAEQSLDISELLLNSLLVPFGRRTLTEFQVKFCHKSFHEFFVAQAILNSCLTKKEKTDELLYCIVSPSIEQFTLGLLQSASTTTRLSIQEALELRSSPSNKAFICERILMWLAQNTETSLESHG